MAHSKNMASLNGDKDTAINKHLKNILMSDELVKMQLRLFWRGIAHKTGMGGFHENVNINIIFHCQTSNTVFPRSIESSSSAETSALI